MSNVDGLNLTRIIKQKGCWIFKKILSNHIYTPFESNLNKPEVNINLDKYQTGFDSLILICEKRNERYDEVRTNK